jgi:hypothetical protein
MLKELDAAEGSERNGLDDTGTPDLGIAAWAKNVDAELKDMSNAYTVRVLS